MPLGTIPRNVHKTLSGNVPKTLPGNIPKTHNTRTKRTLVMNNIGAFLSAPDMGSEGFTYYDTNTGLSDAKAYAADDSNVGAKMLRKLSRPWR